MDNKQNEASEKKLEGYCLAQNEPWKTISFGDVKSSLEFSNLLEFYYVGYSVQRYLEMDFLVNNQLAEKDLILLSVWEIGFPNGASRKRIYDEVLSRLGLKLCPGEVGPQLRLQYEDQPKDERIYVGMQPVDIYEESSLIFVIYHSGPPFSESGNIGIDMISCPEDEFFHPSELFVFSL